MTSQPKAFDESGVQFAYQRLLKKAKRNENGCLITHVKPNVKGYSNTQVGGRGGKFYRIHRLTWEAANGKIPEGLMVCHSCDTRNCMEITHLFLGTAADNSKDMSIKNRAARLGRPPIAFELLEEAAELRACGLSLQDIAEIQGLSGKSSVADRLRRYANVSSS